MLNELYKKADKKLAEFVSIANANGYPIRTPYLEIRKMGYRKAGHCSMDGIALNLRFILEHEEEMFHDTLGHELAHWIQFELGISDYTRTGREKHHGPKFKALCRMLGVSDSTCHKMKLKDAPKRKRQKRYPYLCGCEGRVHHISANRVGRMKKGNSRYWCIHCNKDIVPAFDS